jgi:hypothetical protein
MRKFEILNRWRRVKRRIKVQNEDNVDSKNAWKNAQRLHFSKLQPAAIIVIGVFAGENTVLYEIKIWKRPTENEFPASSYIPYPFPFSARRRRVTFYEMKYVI